MFGLPMPASVSYWGARALFINGQITLLPDRQTYQGEDNDQFTEWLDNHALPWLRNKVVEIELSRDDPQVITLSEFKYELSASTKGSHGYLYIGAVEYKQEEAAPYTNPATFEKEKVVVVNNKKFVVDKGIVPVGTEGEILRIGKVKVVGYYNEVYSNDHSLACLLVEMENPPEWLIKNKMTDDAKKLVDSGVLPKDKKACYSKPNMRSKAYLEWKKNWKMGPIVVWSNDFHPKTS